MFIYNHKFNVKKHTIPYCDCSRCLNKQWNYCLWSKQFRLHKKQWKAYQRDMRKVDYNE